ncbi:MAG: hypothetical protein ACRDL8_06820, partial [Solirubrobacteraceae bacterium]
QLTFMGQVLCDSQVEFGGQSACTSPNQYPRVTKIVMHKLPKHLATMRNPCKGVPSNPWCGRRKA